MSTEENIFVYKTLQGIEIIGTEVKHDGRNKLSINGQCVEEEYYDIELSTITKAVEVKIQDGRVAIKPLLVTGELDEEINIGKYDCLVFRGKLNAIALENYKNMFSETKLIRPSAMETSMILKGDGR